LNPNTWRTLHDGAYLFLIFSFKSVGYLPIYIEKFQRYFVAPGNFFKVPRGLEQPGALTVFLFNALGACETPRAFV
jgi:hypothetical protein